MDNVVLFLYHSTFGTFQTTSNDSQSGPQSSENWTVGPSQSSMLKAWFGPKYTKIGFLPTHQISNRNLCDLHCSLLAQTKL